MSREFHRLLIANRGEIAVRLIRAARELGLETIAVHSDADRAALHVLEADRAIGIGPAPAAESYLSIPAVLEAARASGAEAIHPGYGFLSENAEFAQAVIDAGLIWVGPPPEAMRLLGDKLGAKALAAKLGIPTVSGDDSERDRMDRSAEPLDAKKADAALITKAKGVGFPLLLKAVAGGGGKGMRRVDHEKDLPEAIRSARREGHAAFGDSRLLVERFVSPAHHVEIQVFADAHGHVIHLGERECSIQRRHQKIVEESPSPTIEPAVREVMADAAVTLVRAAGYRSAGTCEFLLDESGRFYFLEVNTRLQVEHPVTEMVTGMDLARMQMVEATGKDLSRGQSVVEWRGHAIECRLYAEDPERGFLPSSGPVLMFKAPEGPGVRVDSGIMAGWHVGVHYDPILAKIIVHDYSRERAVARMQRALAETVLLGLTTNLPFLQAVVRHPEFMAGRTPIDFLDTHLANWHAHESPPGTDVLALAAMAEWERLGMIGNGRGPAAGVGGQYSADDDPSSPWRQLGAFRLGQKGR
ncbi:MAG: biotin carboxylase N-terminal domain-containing protein [Candidatus Eisenbacteria bacterium]|nr:biotin carboxylase N-terminal domain-containing protein [Candidatus Eisenbacteria bacterium]